MMKAGKLMTLAHVGRSRLQYAVPYSAHADPLTLVGYRTGVAHKNAVWHKLHGGHLYPFHVQFVQNYSWGDKSSCTILSMTATLNS
jgi:hypothetical protein